MLTGLILTDISRLSQVLSCSSDKLNEAISSYVQSCNSFMNWQVIDVSDTIYEGIDKSDWHAFASALSDYYEGLGLRGTSYCPLFILGGDDIVPMPPIQNPIGSLGREYLYADMAYCFEVGSHPRLSDFVSATPRFAVGRLPLTKDWDIDALSAYLNDCVDLATKGIAVRGAAMTTTQSWLRASKEMMRDIPTVSLSADYVPLNEKMIVSPDLDMDYQEMVDGYIHELKKVDFLVCNLHGCDRKEKPVFFGEDVDRASHPVALKPQVLEQTSPYIFNTVACFGGRYIGYELNESMLLTAFAYGTMLYCGSCEIALGGNDMEGYSELLMKLYNIYLHKGMPAGLALMKAKQDYYRTCHEDEDDAGSMYTILEFNLFGCPIISMQPKLGFDYKPRLLGHHIAQKSLVSYRPKTVEVIVGGAHRADDIHAYVQGLVDNNLNVIRQKVEKDVYQRLGLGSENLQQVMRVSQDNFEIGYQFLYAWAPQESMRFFEMYYLVSTDRNGEITKIIQTK